MVKPEDNGAMAVSGSSSKTEKRYPTVYLPVSQQIINALAVGDAVEVTLKGKVSALSSDKGSKSERHNLTVELREVEAYPDDSATEDSETPAEKKKGMKEEIDEGLGYKEE